MINYKRLWKSFNILEFVPYVLLTGCSYKSCIISFWQCLSYGQNNIRDGL